MEGIVLAHGVSNAGTPLSSWMKHNLVNYVEAGHEDIHGLRMDSFSTLGLGLGVWLTVCSEKPCPNECGNTGKNRIR